MNIIRVVRKYLETEHKKLQRLYPNSGNLTLVPAIRSLKRDTKDNRVRR